MTKQSENKQSSLKDIPDIVVLKRQKEWCENKDLPFTYEAFPQWPEKLIYRKMEKLVDKGYLEYGVSLRTSWLTDKGLELINLPPTHDKSNE